MADKPVTEVQGIGRKTAEKLKRRLPRNRRTGEVTVSDVRSLGTGQGDVADVELTERQKQNLVDETSIGRVGSTFESVGFSGSRESKVPEGFNRQGDFLFEEGQRKEAFREFNDLPEDRQQADKNERARVTTDLEEWEDNMSGLDFPGVDTPQRKPREEDKDLGFSIFDL